MSTQQLLENYRLASVAFLKEPCPEKRKHLAACIHALSVGIVIALPGAK